MLHSLYRIAHGDGKILYYLELSIKAMSQRQKHRSMKQNRKPRDKSMHLWTPYL